MADLLRGERVLLHSMLGSPHPDASLSQQVGVRPGLPVVSVPSSGKLALLLPVAVLTSCLPWTQM